MICVSEKHFLKAPSPIEVTDDGIEIWVSEKHFLKAFFPIDVTDDGIAIYLIFLLFRNKLSLILSTFNSKK